jgi:hypothetical protein
VRERSGMNCYTRRSAQRQSGDQAAIVGSARRGADATELWRGCHHGQRTAGTGCHGVVAGCCRLWQRGNGRSPVGHRRRRAAVNWAGTGFGSGLRAASHDSSRTHLLLLYRCTAGPGKRVGPSKNPSGFGRGFVVCFSFGASSPSPPTPLNAPNNNRGAKEEANQLAGRSMHHPSSFLRWCHLLGSSIGHQVALVNSLLTRIRKSGAIRAVQS